jgi:hypothetical protein
MLEDHSSPRWRCSRLLQLDRNTAVRIFREKLRGARFAFENIDLDLFKGNPELRQEQTNFVSVP